MPNLYVFPNHSLFVGDIPHSTWYQNHQDSVLAHRSTFDREKRSYLFRIKGKILQTRTLQHGDKGFYALCLGPSEDQIRRESLSESILAIQTIRDALNESCPTFVEGGDNAQPPSLNFFCPINIIPLSILDSDGVLLTAPTNHLLQRIVGRDVDICFTIRHYQHIGPNGQEYIGAKMHNVKLADDRNTQGLRIREPLHVQPHAPSYFVIM